MSQFTMVDFPLPEGAEKMSKPPPAPPKEGSGWAPFVVLIVG